MTAGASSSAGAPPRAGPFRPAASTADRFQRRTKEARRRAKHTRGVERAWAGGAARKRISLRTNADRQPLANPDFLPGPSPETVLDRRTRLFSGFLDCPTATLPY